MPSFFKPVYESTGAAEKLIDRGFTENLVNAYSWQYSPIIGATEEFFLFKDAEYDKSYNPLDDIEGFELYASEFAKSKNKEHTLFIKNRIRQSEKTRADLANLDWYAPSQLIAGILDPLNLAFAIPFFGQAGAATKVAMTAKQAFAKGAGGGFLAGAAGEIARAPFDPVATKQESLAVLTASTILGGALASAPAVYRNVAPVAKESVEKLKTTMTDKGDWIKNKYEDVTLKFDEGEPTPAVTPDQAVTPAEAPVVAQTKPPTQKSRHKIQSGIELKGKVVGDIEDLNALDNSVSDILDSVAGKNNATERAAIKDLKAIQQERERRASIIPEKKPLTVNEDKTVFEINTEAVKRDFEKKAWTDENHPDYAQGVGKQEFQTAIEYQDFLIHREKVKKEKGPRDPFVPEEDYMEPINAEALRRTHTGYGQKKTLATDSVWYKLITTPAKRILGNPKIPELAKKYHQYISGNGAMAIDRNVGGRGVQSIIQRDPVYYVKGQQLLEEIGLLVDKERNVKSKDLMGLRAETFGFNTREEAIQEKFKAYLLASEKWGTVDRFKGMSDIDKEIFQKIDDWFNWFDDQGKSVGLWRNKGDLVKEKELRLELIDKHEPTMKDIERKTKGRGMTEKQAAYYNKLKEIVTKAKKELTEIGELLKENIEDITFYFPRVWNRELLINDNVARNKLRKILIEYIEKYRDDFAEIYSKELEIMVPRSVDPEKIASGIIRTIMYGPSKEGDVFSALIDDVIDPARTVGSRFSRRRLLNKLPDWQIAEFLRTDTSIIDHYAKTVGRKIEWAKKFGRKDIDTILNEIELEALREGKLSEKEIAEMRRDFLADYEFSMGLHIRSPDRWDNVAVKAIKDVASMTYLHGAGIASITDIGVIAFEHGIGKLIKPLLEKDSRSAMAMAAAEVKKIVKGTDFAMSSARERFFSDNIHRLEQNAVEKYLNPITNAFYTIPIIGNNLGIVTRYLKILEGILRQDKLVNLAIDIANNKAGADIEYWARYGLDINDAKKIASYKDRFVIEEDFTFANTENWPRLTQEDEDLLFKWNTAMNSGVGNTIMHATAMDKPIISRGVVYVRYHDWMKNVPFFDKLKIDKQASTSNYKYARIESGAMTMPFQFMDFTLAASNRITASMLDPARKNRLVGAMSLFGMAYLSLQVRKPDWWFENKGTGEIIARTLDYSGLFGVYSDIGYTMLHMATGLGAIDADNTFLRGKYKPETATEAWLEPLGAGPGLISEYLFMANDFLNGDTTEAAERFKYNMPWRNMTAPIHDFLFKD